MRFAFFQSAERAAGPLRDALIDPARRERAVIVSLACYVLLWTIYGTISRSAQGLNPDMTELIAWSRDLSYGYLKHPPFAAWLTWIWFSVFPITEWAFYLLAMLMPAIAMWIVWRVSLDYLDAEKRIVAVALLTFIPFFNFHALKFNVNTVLLPLWAATTWFFLCSVRTRGAVWAALAGIAAAGAMLGKYWSIFLLLGLALAAVIDRRHFEYFRSPAPFVTVLAGSIVLMPHIIWLIEHRFAPFSYATTVHTQQPFAAVLQSSLSYLLGSIAYVTVPIILFLVRARPSWRTVMNVIWPPDDDRRLVASSFWGPLILPAGGAIIAGAEITSLWSMPALSLLPVLLLSSPSVTIRAIDTRRTLAAAVALPLVMLIVSPAIMVMAQRRGPLPAAAQARLLTAEVERLWHQATPQKLRFVGGEEDIADGVITYAVDRPRALIGMVQPDAVELAKSGLVLVCFAGGASCQREAAPRGAAATLVETEIVRNFAGIAGKPQRYTIVIVPPRP
ncbi:MAG TPA: glycosyltransferase family 39 protein [Pseudolabrys sp.]|nr:glycosyltransferase family 39 protein [Pseudolabrys sp.]